MIGWIYLVLFPYVRKGFLCEFVVFMCDWFFLVLGSAEAFIILISGIRGYDGVQQDYQGPFAMDMDV